MKRFFFNNSYRKTLIINYFTVDLHDSCDYSHFYSILLKIVCFPRTRVIIPNNSYTWIYENRWKKIFKFNCYANSAIMNGMFLMFNAPFVIGNVWEFPCKIDVSKRNNNDKWNKVVSLRIVKKNLRDRYTVIATHNENAATKHPFA